MLFRSETGLANLCFPRARANHRQIVSPFTFRSAPLSRKLFLLAETICPQADNLEQGHKKYGDSPLDSPHIFYLRCARPVRVSLIKFEFLNINQVSFSLIFPFSKTIFFVVYNFIHFRKVNKSLA